MTVTVMMMTMGKIYGQILMLIIMAMVMIQIVDLAR